MRIQEQVQNKLVQLFYVRSGDNSADMMTKVLSGPLQRKHAKRALGISDEEEARKYQQIVLNQELWGQLDEIEAQYATCDKTLRLAEEELQGDIRAMRVARANYEVNAAKFQYFKRQ